MIKEKTSSHLDLSVIIPFKDKSEMTIQCINSLLEFGPTVKELILVSNNSSNEEYAKVESYATQYDFIQLYKYDYPFNYQKINNWAVAKSTAASLMFLNNDTELRESSRGLIEKMYKKAHQKDVGMVGCLLLFGDERTIQHAGVFLMPEGQADHVYITKKYSQALARLNEQEFPYDISQDRPLTAVTGAVQLVERKKFEKIKGFDERFIICGGDVDLCIRLNKAGYQTWYQSGGYILHKESQSRKFTPIPYNDFFWSYKSYLQGYDINVGDPFVPKITKYLKVHGA